ncbi:Uncharacterised protein [Vibrio cholerae]|uniref:Uncharacterized protein n=1 Tax=Vibrio cholerae TaxID=666 RepID=A0A656AIL8_VIBCL|nr:Uncharacterised protein [Vibrio cholerae]
MLRAAFGNLIARISVAHYACGWVIVQYTSDTFGGIITAIAANHHTGML